MTAPTEKAAPIPAEDAVNTVAGILALNYGREYVTGRDLEVAEEIVAALAGGQEERIREDERATFVGLLEEANERLEEIYDPLDDALYDLRERLTKALEQRP